MQIQDQNNSHQESVNQNPNHKNNNLLGESVQIKFIGNYKSSQMMKSYENVKLLTGDHDQSENKEVIIKGLLGIIAKMQNS